MNRQGNVQGAIPPIERFFLVIDTKNKVVESSTVEEEMVEVCKTVEGMKKKYRMVETTVTRIHIFSVWDSEKTF